MAGCMGWKIGTGQVQDGSVRRGALDSPGGTG